MVVVVVVKDPEPLVWSCRSSENLSALEVSRGSTCPLRPRASPRVGPAHLWPLLPVAFFFPSLSQATPSLYRAACTASVPPQRYSYTLLLFLRGINIFTFQRINTGRRGRQIDGRIYSYSILGRKRKTVNLDYY